MFKKIARSSKCDFRNLEQKWDRYRWSTFFSEVFFFVEKNPIKNVDFFGRTFLVENLALQCKSLCKGISLYKGIYIVKPHFRPKMFDQKNRHFWSEFFRRKKNFRKKSWPPISIPFLLKIPKIALRTACDFLNMRTTRPKKKPFFFTLLSIRPRPGRTRFVNLLFSSVIYIPVPALR